MAKRLKITKALYLSHVNATDTQAGTILMYEIHDNILLIRLYIKYLLYNNRSSKLEFD